MSGRINWAPPYYPPKQHNYPPTPPHLPEGNTQPAGIQEISIDEILGRDGWIQSESLYLLELLINKVAFNKCFEHFKAKFDYYSTMRKCTAEKFSDHLKYLRRKIIKLPSQFQQELMKLTPTFNIQAPENYTLIKWEDHHFNLLLDLLSLGKSYKECASILNKQFPELSKTSLIVDLDCKLQVKHLRENLLFINKDIRNKLFALFSFQRWTSEMDVYLIQMYKENNRCRTYAKQLADRFFVLKSETACAQHCRDLRSKIQLAEQLKKEASVDANTPWEPEWDINLLSAIQSGLSFSEFALKFEQHLNIPMDEEICGDHLYFLKMHIFDLSKNIQQQLLNVLLLPNFKTPENHTFQTWQEKYYQLLLDLLIEDRSYEACAAILANQFPVTDLECKFQVKYLIDSFPTLDSLTQLKLLSGALLRPLSPEIGDNPQQPPQPLADTSSWSELANNSIKPRSTNEEEEEEKLPDNPQQPPLHLTDVSSSIGGSKKDVWFDFRQQFFGENGIWSHYSKNTSSTPPLPPAPPTNDSEIGYVFEEKTGNGEERVYSHNVNTLPSPDVMSREEYDVKYRYLIQRSFEAQTAMDDISRLNIVGTYPLNQVTDPRKN